ncbi:MAG: hypothetical protein ACK5KP_07850 [Paludibacteraceae bacterium]
MKGTLPHIVFSLLLAAMFLLAGTGYNIVQFCCDDCRNAGVEHLAEVACASVHEHHHVCKDTAFPPDTQSKTCMHALEKGCNINRLTVDVPSIGKNQFSFHDIYSVYIELFGSILEVEELSEITFKSGINYSPPEDFILQKGRKILCQKSVLII